MLHLVVWMLLTHSRFTSCVAPTVPGGKLFLASAFDPERAAFGRL